MSGNLDGATALSVLEAAYTMTMDYCTCGGAGPGEGCPACEIYHALDAKFGGGIRARPSPFKFGPGE